LNCNCVGNLYFLLCFEGVNWEAQSIEMTDLKTIPIRNYCKEKMNNYVKETNIAYLEIMT